MSRDAGQGTQWRGAGREDPAEALRRAVFEASYRSRRQRGLRAAAFGVLLLRHGLRGALLALPLFLAAAAALATGHALAWLLVPALGIWLLIGLRGARADYRRRVSGRLLDRRGALRGGSRTEP